MNIEVAVRFFATLRDRSGTTQTQITLDGNSVADLIAAVGKKYPEVKEALPTALIAVNHEYAFPGDTLQDGDEVAIFPPVSGGAGEASTWPTYVAITEDTLDLNDITTRITGPEAGAVCMFSGAVRGRTKTDRGKEETSYLHYDAYIPMAEEKLKQVAKEIREKWPMVQGVAVIQRIGKLDVGETTVMVACASGHRDEGCFEGARYGIDRLKEIVPVWKKEVGPDGSEWVEGKYMPTPEDRMTPEE